MEAKNIKSAVVNIQEVYGGITVSANVSKSDGTDIMAADKTISGGIVMDGDGKNIASFSASSPASMQVYFNAEDGALRAETYSVVEQFCAAAREFIGKAVIKVEEGEA